MNNNLKSFIDDLIRENADKSYPGYCLCVDVDLNERQKEAVINKITTLTPEVIKNLILEHAQDLIDHRIEIVESEDRYESGIRAKIDRNHGDVIFNQVGV